MWTVSTNQEEVSWTLHLNHEKITIAYKAVSNMPMNEKSSKSL